MLQAIKFIQNIGRFHTATPIAHASFGKCTLVFGENGWGKSTLSDILRSLTTDTPEIIIGRKTLAGGLEQKTVLQFNSQTACFSNGSWTGIKPKIAVFDSSFINDNVFSGDTVTNDHLKKQYGLVVGEEGVRLVHQSVDLDSENTENNKTIKSAERELTAVIRSIMSPQTMPLDDFIKIENCEDIEQKIEAKQLEVQQAKKTSELKAAPEPNILHIPSQTDQFKSILALSIDSISEAALESVISHVAKHKCDEAKMTHESWLEVGASFPSTDDCPFCGQKIEDKTLVESFKDFFGASYKQLSKDVQTSRQTFQRYKSGDFRRTVEELERHNNKSYEYWKEAAKIEVPDTAPLSDIIGQMEKAAEVVDSIFHEKQSNLTEAVSPERLSGALESWESGRNAIKNVNNEIEAYREKVKSLKSSLDLTRLPQLESELKNLKLIKRRYEPDINETIETLKKSTERKNEIKEQKDNLRTQLTTHAKSITDTLGVTINSYLKRLNAGFRIDYEKPNYQGKEPAASYQLLINEVAVAPKSKSGSLDQPSFRNTLSAGDKSTLALALFLARINADPLLSETIVVLDDPFTSLDNFRRQFTAIEIRKLCNQSKQTIVFSHDKNFLRLLWDKIDHSIIKVIALQTGAPGITTIAPLDIEKSTRPRHVTERMQIEEYIEGEPHELSYIRTRLRTVCEDFYRRGDPNLFGEAASLEEIIRKLNEAPDDHPYKGALDDLRDINEYSRGDNHAEIFDNPHEETSEDELKGFCQRVLDLTRGM